MPACSIIHSFKLIRKFLLNAHHVQMHLQCSQTCECSFWCLWNSSIDICSLQKALMVGRPANVVVMCEYSGLRAVQKEKSKCSQVKVDCIIIYS